MCKSEHEECDEARDARYRSDQSRRPGAIGMPWIVSAMDAAKLLTMENIEAAR